MSRVTKESLSLVQANASCTYPPNLKNNVLCRFPESMVTDVDWVTSDMIAVEDVELAWISLWVASEDDGILDVVDIELASVADGDGVVDVSESNVVESELLSVGIPVFRVDMTEALDIEVMLVDSVLERVDVNAVSLADGNVLLVVDVAVVIDESDDSEVPEGIVAVSP